MKLLKLIVLLFVSFASGRRLNTFPQKWNINDSFNFVLKTWSFLFEQNFSSIKNFDDFDLTNSLDFYNSYLEFDPNNLCK